jgi:hypothetical protein
MFPSSPRSSLRANTATNCRNAIWKRSCVSVLVLEPPEAGGGSIFRAGKQQGAKPSPEPRWSVESPPRTGKNTWLVK